MAVTPRPDPLDAGELGAWVEELRSAMRGERATDVACGTCTGCCTSSQFVLIEPDERDALAAIPAALLFPAPRMAKGNMVLGYDERGHCPLLVDGACSIYEVRPRTCRTYDCRVFEAAGVRIDDPSKSAIDATARRWRFSHSSDASRAKHDAMRRAASWLTAHGGALPDDIRPHTSTHRAVMAVRLLDVFLARTSGEPTAAEVCAALRSSGGLL